jgi:hypothetical protein
LSRKEAVLTPFRPYLALWAVIAAAGILSVSGCAHDDAKSSMTVYEDAPTLNPVDVGKPGNSPGDGYYFFANLRDQAGGPVTGHVYGSKTLVKPEDASKPGTEQRATMLFFVFDKSQDQIVVAGVPDYPPNAPEFAAGSACAAGSARRNGKVQRREWPAHQHPQRRRFVQAGIFADQGLSGQQARISR